MLISKILKTTDYWVWNEWYKLKKNKKKYLQNSGVDLTLKKYNIFCLSTPKMNIQKIENLSIIFKSSFEDVADLQINLPQ